MFDSHWVVCSPSGRYVCREKRTGGCRKLRKMYFFDLQEEICHKISLVGVRYHMIAMLYWLDETHLVAIFFFVGPEKKKPIRILQRALYKVDFTKKKLEPKKLVYWRKGEMSLHRTEFSNGFVTINNHEYIVHVENWYNNMPEDQKKHFDDLETYEWFNGNKDDYTWLRFIPKGFENEPEIGKIYVNQGDICRAAGILSETQSIVKIFAFKSKVYLPLHDGTLVVDMDKHFYDFNKKSDLILSSDHCTIVKIKDSSPHNGLSYYQNGLFYVNTRAKDEDHNLYTRIWDIEKNLITTHLMVVETEPDITHDPTVLNRGFKRILHPCGYFIQTEDYTKDVRIVESRIFGRYSEHSPKKCFTFNNVPLKSIRTKVDSLQQIAIDHIILSKSRNPEMCPPFIKDGRKLITIPVEK